MHPSVSNWSITAIAYLRNAALPIELDIVSVITITNISGLGTGVLDITYKTILNASIGITYYRTRCTATTSGDSIVKKILEIFFTIC